MEEKKIEEQKGKQALKKPVWDCGSSLYDSFELKSFERQLDSAMVSSRTQSMPHLPDRQALDLDLDLPPPGPQLKPIMSRSKPSKFSRSFHKLLKSVFGPKQQQASPTLFNLGGPPERFYVVGTGSSSSLSTIPEAAETAMDHGGVSPDFAKSVVKSSASERFTAASVGISCA